jgi:DNA-binding transcriptional MerR regulator
MRMGEMSQRTGVHERMLRYYEQRGLLHPQRRPSGYREYDEADVTTVHRIRALLDAGLSTALIAEVLPCVREDDALLRPACPQVRAGLAAERERMNSAIAALTSSRDLLDRVLSPVPAAAGTAT